MENALIAKIFTDPICGDGVCDSPEEYAGFGRFGCVADCGKYLDTTTITIDLQDILQLTVIQKIILQSDPPEENTVKIKC